ncbi:hypothetical protein JWV37_10740 [Sulfurospirillum sp. T05]|uniref:Plasmid mobilization relaxosome protein MobC n=1 Tax=Sulfurospirillum tamanense TaxID=2813362 RepID=A0ABS2WVL1_9BACT|nr:hypothetical protein [Sulfurospirillum tamanensis]MBN2965259.1 hypothetical protein [Sulfurospirillum tamanensis]
MAKKQEQRSIRFELILEEETYKKLAQQAKKSNKTKAKFLRDLIEKRYGNKKLGEIERIYLLNTQIVLDISRVTGNINQIAYQLNKNEVKFDSINSEWEFYELAEELIKKVKEAMAELKPINKQLKALL